MGTSVELRSKCWRTYLTLSAVSDVHEQDDRSPLDLDRLLELRELAAGTPLAEEYTDRLLDAVWGDVA